MELGRSTTIRNRVLPMNLAIHPILNLLIFPCGLFLIACGLFYEFLDRKLVARYQNRIGPRWFQPLADVVKLLAKRILKELKNIIS